MKVEVSADFKVSNGTMKQIIKKKKILQSWILRTVKRKRNKEAKGGEDEALLVLSHCDDGVSEEEEKELQEKSGVRKGRKVTWEGEVGSQ